MVPPSQEYRKLLNATTPETSASTQALPPSYTHGHRHTHAENSQMEFIVPSLVRSIRKGIAYATKRCETSIRVSRVWLRRVKTKPVEFHQVTRIY